MREEPGKPDGMAGARPRRRTSALAGRALAALLAAAFALLAAGTRGQGAGAGPIAIPAGTKPEAPPPKAAQATARHRIVVPVTEVVAPVIVRDGTGDMVMDLTAPDFQVYDDGVPQQIEHFDLGGDNLSLALVLESSSRIEALLPGVRTSGIVFSETVMGGGDDGGLGAGARAAVLSYDDTVSPLAKFTSDRDRVQSVINHLQEGTSGAHLYDAMSQAISMLEEQPPQQRRILCVIGESHDSGSQAKLGEVLRAAQLANVTIYSVGLSTTRAEMRAPISGGGAPSATPPGIYPMPGPNGQPQTPQLAEAGGGMNLLALAQLLVSSGKNMVLPNALEVASRATGGIHVNPKKDAAIQTALDEIGGEIHGEYIIGYQPTGTPSTGYHHIRITVARPGLSARTRPGYYLAPGS